MTILLYKNGVVYTDSFTIVESDSFGANLCFFAEKTYKDPAKRFIFTICGDQLWLKDWFEKDIEIILEYVKNIEKTGRADNKILEGLSKIPRKSTYNMLDVNGFLLTRKNCYMFEKGTIPKVRTEPTHVGLHKNLLGLFLAAGYSHEEAFKLIVKHEVSGVGGTIYTYKKTSLKAL